MNHVSVTSSKTVGGKQIKQTMKSATAKFTANKKRKLFR